MVVVLLQGPHRMWGVGGGAGASQAVGRAGTVGVQWGRGGGAAAGAPGRGKRSSRCRRRRAAAAGGMLGQAAQERGGLALAARSSSQ